MRRLYCFWYQHLRLNFGDPLRNEKYYKIFIHELVTYYNQIAMYLFSRYWL